MNQELTATRSRSGGRRTRPWLYRVCYEERPRRRASLILGALTLVITLLVAFLSFQDALLPYDRQISEWAQTLDFGAAQPFFDLIGAPGYSPWNFVVVAGLGLGVTLWLGWKVGLFYMALTALQGILTVVMKYPIRIPRPQETDLNAPVAAIANSSFPSGHTTMYVVLFGFLLYLLWRHRAPGWLRWGTLVITVPMILLIGPERVHLGAHWVGDVIAAYLLGALVVLLGIDGYEKWLLPRLDDIDPEDGYDDLE